MRPSEFVRNISEVDVALGRLRGFVCTESRCDGEWVSCNNQDMERARELLVKLREFGLPDLPAELEKVVGRPVAADDVCVFSVVNWLYPHCVLLNEERCREKLRYALEGAREMVEVARERKKRLENLLRKLGSAVDQFKLSHDFVDGSTLLKLPLAGCGTELKYDPFYKDFEVKYYLPTRAPLARRVGAWLAGAVDDALRSLGVGEYSIDAVYDVVAIWLSGLDPGAALKLFEPLTDLALVLGEACAAFPVKYLARKTKEKVRV